MPPYDPYQFNKASLIATGNAADAVASKAAYARAIGQGLGVPTSSGVFGDLPPEALFGLTGEQVDSVAKARVENALSKAMANAKVLDFVRTLSGQDLQDTLTTEQVKNANQFDIAAMNADQQNREAALQADAHAATLQEPSHDKMRARAEAKLAAWQLDPKKNAKTTNSELFLTTYGTQVQKARAIRSLLGAKVEALKAGKLDDQTIGLLTGLGMSMKEAVADVSLADESDNLFGAPTKPGKTGAKQTREEAIAEIQADARFKTAAEKFAELKKRGF